jgi:FkbM family methyltransferase
VAETPDAEFNRLKDCRYGKMLYNANDTYIGRSLDLYGEFSEGEVGVFRQIVHAGDIVLDIGANIGAHTVFFAKATGPTGGVLAFEPQRLVFQVLCANMALNNLSNVWCFQQALGDSPGSILVPALDPRMSNNFGGLELGGSPAPGAAGDTVPIIRVDSFGLPGCRLMKIDVEGMESQVLRGATGLLERFRPVLYVENDRPERSDELVRFIDSLQYDMFWDTPPLYNPANFLKNPENVFGAIVSKNMLCVPRESDVNINGPRVQVPGA